MGILPIVNHSIKKRVYYQISYIFNKIKGSKIIAYAFQLLCISLSIHLFSVRWKSA